MKFTSFLPVNVDGKVQMVNPEHIMNIEVDPETESVTIYMSDSSFFELEDRNNPKFGQWISDRLEYVLR